MGLFINILLRISILYFLGEVFINPEDPRFAGKAIPLRNLIIVLTFSLLFPVLYFFGKKRFDFAHHKYPFWLDNLYLSIFTLDMAGNSLNLYDSYYFFDLIPHFHGTGAISAIFLWVFKIPLLSAIGLANIIHLILESQEFYTDILFGTQNVRGVFDVINDLMVGLLGTVMYTAGLKLYIRFGKILKILGR